MYAADPACTVFQHEPTWNEVFATPPIFVSECWHHRALPFTFAFVFAISPKRIYFGGIGDFAATSKPESHRNHFTEGLWESDVVELFLADGNTNRYQEFNVAPNGAWWTAAFNDYRELSSKPIPEAALSEVEILSDESPAGFRVGMSYPRSGLRITIGDSSQPIANLAAIFGNAPRTFISVHLPNAGKPDFHHSGCFKPVRLISAS